MFVSWRWFTLPVLLQMPQKVPVMIILLLIQIIMEPIIME